MVIIKNAWRNITRSKGRSLLILLITFILGCACCLALSIRQAANSSEEEGLKNLTITASIGIDRMSMMEKQRNENPESIDPADLKSMMEETSTLTLEEYERYAKAESVASFAYTKTVAVNGTENKLEAVTTSNEMRGPVGQISGEEGKQGNFKAQSDFQIIGASSDEVLQDFTDGTNEISDGVLFEEGTTELSCIIHEELATLNNLHVNDSITLTNPNDDQITYTFTISGIYTSTSSGGMGGPIMQDPANVIYTSSNAIDQMLSQDSSLTATLNGIYTFDDLEQYEAFEEQARALGLDDTYTISSQDLMSYEASLQPLQNLSKYAGYFLIVIFIIGGCILIAFNIFNIRERKYEIGVLAAIGMNKRKVTSQFICEVFIIMISGILIGSGAGAIASVPVTNTLLEHQATSVDFRMERNFDRGDRDELSQEEPSSERDSGFMMSNTIQEVTSATNLTVLFQLLGIAIVLTIFSGGAAVLSIMRYDPLKILANRE